MFHPSSPHRQQSYLPTLLAALLVFGTSADAVPLEQATVTRVENRVDYGTVRQGRSEKRRASVADIVRANNFLLTETESRAELEYSDGTVVRIGQNTVFSFEAATRTLTLSKGALIFYMPKGAGGGQIKTPSLTAAITGTVGKVSADTIAILEGEVTLVPSGRKVREGFFARSTAGGIIIEPFDLSRAMDGRLMTFNGPMPGFRRGLLAPRSSFDPQALTLDLSPLTNLEALERTQNHPNAIERFFPTPVEAPRIFEDPEPKHSPPPHRPPPPPPPPPTEEPR